MAWTTPKTWAALTTLTASDLNQQVRDNLNYLKPLAEVSRFSGVQASRTTDQSIPNADPTFVTLNSQNWDVGGWFDGNDTQVIVPAAAIPAGFTSIAVLAIATVEWEDSDGTGSRLLRLKKNGTGFGAQRIAGINEPQALFCNEATTCAEGDYFQIEVDHSEGHSLSITYASLTIVRVGVYA